jgi:hypothetical protein
MVLTKASAHRCHLLEACNIEGREAAMPFIRDSQRVPSQRRLPVYSVVSVVTGSLIAAYDRANLKSVSREVGGIYAPGKGMLAGSSYLKLEKLSS